MHKFRIRRRATAVPIVFLEQLQRLAAAAAEQPVVLQPRMLVRTAGVAVAVPNMSEELRRPERELQAKAMLVAPMVRARCRLTVILVAVAVAQALWAMPRPLQNPVTAAQA